MNYSSSPFFDCHERVVPVEDKATGLSGFIAIHSTALGPATGGTRFWRYASRRAALDDALRLSRAMTFKCALAGVPFGGGKGVLVARPGVFKTARFLKAYARCLNALGGAFSTGEDVGISEEDVAVLVKYSPHVNGRTRQSRSLGPWAALGVFYAMRSALRAVFGTRSLRGRTVAVKGLGKVGLNLCRLVVRHGGAVVGADVDVHSLRAARREFPAMRVVSPGEIHKQRSDVYSPCALGDDLTRQTIPHLQCSIVCGGANNQLQDDSCGAMLHRAGILYVPDYVANAGGLINAVAELMPGGWSAARVKRGVKGIGGTVEKVIALSVKENRPTDEVADHLAEAIFRGR